MVPNHSFASTDLDKKRMYMMHFQIRFPSDLRSIPSSIFFMDAPISRLQQKNIPCSPQKRGTG